MWRLLYPQDRLSQHPTAGSSLNAVDLYDSATGTWSTAQLSVARARLAATSVGNMAMFAGGDTGWENTGSKGAEEGELRACSSYAFEAVMRLCLSATALILMRALTASVFFDTVDLYNIATGTWSTARLSVARTQIAAAAAGIMALFAGGWTQSALLGLGRGMRSHSNPYRCNF